jgi:hypothetical protein
MSNSHETSPQQSDGSALLRRFVSARGKGSKNVSIADDMEGSISMSKYYDAVADGSSVVSTSMHGYLESRARI